MSDVFNKNESALSNLSKKIFETSLLFSDSLKPNLEKQFGKESKEFYLKYIPVLFEFMYFYLHYVNRLAFCQLGQEKRMKLQTQLGPLVVDTTTETLFGHWPKSLKDGIVQDFYSSLNNAEMEYGACKELLLKPESDTKIIEKITLGKKSQSVVGQLIDNLAEILGGAVNLDIDFTVMIADMVVNSLINKEIADLVLEASKEI